MEQLEILREYLEHNDEIILNALMMRNSIAEEIMAYKAQNPFSFTLTNGVKIEKI